MDSPISMHDKLNKVLEQLHNENYNAIIETKIHNGKEWHMLTWTNEHGDACHIYQDDISIENEKIAWFQSSENDNHLLKIYENGISFSWVPETYNPVFGCNCLLVEWYKNHLIFIYQEKHDIYICSIKDKKIKHFNFHGEEIERKGDFISYETYTDQLPDKVRLIQLPDLIELAPISKAAAENQGLLPDGLNRAGNFLAFK